MERRTIYLALGNHIKLVTDLKVQEIKQNFHSKRADLEEAISFISPIAHNNH